MKKSKINFIIDALMFFCMSMITGIGFLMYYVLISGREVWDKYGSNIELEFLWMDRHTWGDIHLVFGFALLILLLLHIVLHWKMITGLYKSLISDPKKRRNTALIFIGICFILFIFPFLVKPQKGDFVGRGRRNVLEQTNFDNVQTSSNVTQKNIEENKPNQAINLPENENEHNTPFEVRGFMTIYDVAQKYGIPSSYLKSKLRLPASISDNQKLGLLRRQYNFKMSDIEQFIAEYRRK